MAGRFCLAIFLFLFLISPRPKMKSSAPHPAEPEPPWARAELRALRTAAPSAKIVACHAHATPTKKRPESSGSLNNTTEVPPPSAANAQYPIRHS
jgi:hypothetical protein